MILTTEMNYLLLILFFTSTIPFFVNMESIMKNETEQYFIKTPGCKMIRKETFSEEALKFYKKLGPLVCAKEPPLIESDQTSIWISGEAKKARKLPDNLRCCYRSFWRPISDSYSQNIHVDTRIRFDAICNPFEEKTMIYDEFIEVLCFNNNKQVYRDFHAFVPRTRKNKRKHPFQKPSVVIFGIDALSRAGIDRHLPNTLKYIRSLGPYEMHGLNKIGYETFQNMVGLLSGNRTTELTCWNSTSQFFDKCKFLWNYFQQRSYTTAFGEEASHMGLFTYKKMGYHKQPTDIYLFPYMIMNEDFKGIGRNVDGIRQCSGPRGTVQILLDYAKKLIVNMTAEDKPLMAYLWSTTMTHDNFNVHSNADSMYYSFISSLNESGVFNKTIVLLMSDHGLRFGNFPKTYQGYLEERQPFAFFFIPPWMRQKYPQAMQNMNDNQHKLSSTFDLGATLLNIIRPQRLGRAFKYGNGVSLFSKISFFRTCKKAYIPKEFCTCFSSKEVQLPKEDAKFIANKIVAEINNILTNVSSICRRLSLNKVQTVRENKLPSDAQGKYTEYDILLVTTPGYGIFEGTVRADLSLTRANVVGEIIRSDRASKNECVNDARLRSYCYCREKQRTATVSSRNHSRKATSKQPKVIKKSTTPKAQEPLKPTTTLR